MTETPENAHKARILVADDSKLVRMTSAKILGKKFDLVMAENGEEAWQTLNRDASIQVVLTDLGMPELDGYQLIERIRQSDNEGIQNIPVIVITGASEEESVKQKVFEIGATDFITKPFKSTEVIARLEAHASYQRDKATLQEQVDIDLLTGTLNRKGLNEKLEKDVSFVNRHKQNIALVLFELDNFSEIQKKTGKNGSEKIIQNVSKVLNSAIRREDSFGRMDTAKFLTILPMAKTDGVVMLAKRLCEHMKTFKVSIHGESIVLTLSVGIAAVPKGCATTPARLLQTGEQALENAKAVGPGEVQLLKLEAEQAEKKASSFSVDYLLDTIAENERSLLQEELETAVKYLQPLIKLMSKEQKQKLTDRQ